ncbi:MAG: acyltransferase [Phycisphaerae bacterium]
MGEALAEHAKRYTFIDALRGFAAFGVVLHHAFHGSEFHEPLTRIFPGWFQWICSFGARGVQIFFVLSGFVIAYSIRDMRVTPRSMGNFMLRRQIRLDPAYWLCLMLLFANQTMAAHFHPQLVSRPTVPHFFLNMVYVQEMLRIPSLLGVAWTLCLEVQFYILLIVLVGIAQRVLVKYPHYAAAALVGGLGLASLYVRIGVHSEADIPWFIGSWYLFASGALACWTLARRIHPAIFVTFAAMILAAGLYTGQDSIIAGAVTVSLIFTVGTLGHLGDWLANRVIQYFGRISYSLYLIHLLVLERISRVGLHLHGANAPGWAVFWFVVATIASIAAAQLLYVAVERPTVRLAAALKPAKTKAPQAAPEPATALT